MARKLTLEEAQRRFDVWFPDSGIELTMYLGNSREGCLTHPDYGDLRFPHFSNLQFYGTAENLLEGLKNHKLNVKVAAKDTPARAQSDFNRRFPDANLTLVEYGGRNGPGAFETKTGELLPFPSYDEVMAATSVEKLGEMLASYRSENVKQRLQQRDIFVPRPFSDGLGEQAGHELRPTYTVPTPRNTFGDLVNPNWVPVLYLPSIEFIGGYGSQITTIDECEREYIDFDARLLLNRRISADKVVCFSFSGDSMSPMIQEGAKIAVDTADLDLVDGKIYAFVQGGLRRIKRLSKLPEGRLLIRSDNPAYQDEIADAEDIQIVGRVFWYSQEV